MPTQLSINVAQGYLHKMYHQDPRLLNSCRLVPTIKLGGCHTIAGKSPPKVCLVTDAWPLLIRASRIAVPVKMPMAEVEHPWWSSKSHTSLANIATTLLLPPTSSSSTFVGVVVPPVNTANAVAPCASSTSSVLDAFKPESATVALMSSSLPGSSESALEDERLSLPGILLQMHSEKSKSWLLPTGMAFNAYARAALRLCWWTMAPTAHGSETSSLETPHPIDLSSFINLPTLLSGMIVAALKFFFQNWVIGANFAIPPCGLMVPKQGDDGRSEEQKNDAVVLIYLHLGWAYLRNGGVHYHLERRHHRDCFHHCSHGGGLKFQRIFLSKVSSFSKDISYWRIFTRGLRNSAGQETSFEVRECAGPSMWGDLGDELQICSASCDIHSRVSHKGK